MPTKRNKEKAAASHKEWCAKNKDRIAASNKAWRAKNAERFAATKKAWRERNAEKVASQSKDWRERNPEKAAASIARATAKAGIKHRQDMADPVEREKKRKYCREYAARARLDALAALGGRCTQCGLSDIRTLHIDHVRGNGAEERRQRRAYGYYKHIRDNIASGDYQVLCASCNTAKRHSNYEYAPKVGVPRPASVLTDPKAIALQTYYRERHEKRKKDPEWVAKRRARNKQYELEKRQQVLAVLGGHCVHCGMSDPHALNIDHVHSDGAASRRLAHGAKFHNLVIAAVGAGSGDYQLLCASCNWVKRTVHDEFARGGACHSKRKRAELAQANSLVTAQEVPPEAGLTTLVLLVGLETGD